MNNKKHGSTTEHNNLKKAFIMAVSKQFPMAVAIPYDVGFFRAWSNPDQPVKCGQIGIPDIIVFIKGTYLLFDAKTGNADFSKVQKAFKKRIKDINGGMDRVIKLTNVEEGLRYVRGFYAD